MIYIPVSASTYRPEVVDQDVENTQDHDENDSAPLRLEPDCNHHTRHSAYGDHGNPSRCPVTREHESDEQEDQQHTPGQLEIHLPILLIQLRQARRGELLAYPRVGEDHQQAAHDREVAEEEVQIENETVAERLGYDDGDEAGDGLLGVLADDDEEGTGRHGEDVGDEEDVGDAVGDCITHNRVSS